MVGVTKSYFSEPAAVAIRLRGSAVAYRMPGSIQGDDWSTVSSVLYPALDSEEQRAVCPEERE